MNRPLFLGIDIGSTTLKAVLLSADGRLLHSLYRAIQPQSRRIWVCGSANDAADATLAL